jgi:hypothetical protein
VPVRDLGEDGVVVDVRADAGAVDTDHARAGQAFDEARLGWRWPDCDAVKSLADVCPSCGAEMS